MRIYTMHLFFVVCMGYKVQRRYVYCIMQYSMLLHILCYRKGTWWKSTRELSWLGCFRPREPSLLGGDSSNHSGPLGNPRRRRTALPMPIHIYTDESQQSFSRPHAKNMCFIRNNSIKPLRVTLNYIYTMLDGLRLVYQYICVYRCSFVLFLLLLIISITVRVGSGSDNLLFNERAVTSKKTMYEALNPTSISSSLYNPSSITLQNHPTKLPLYLWPPLNQPNKLHPDITQHQN
jgi:hypothetical protein